jgi:hypothetical protein
MSRVESPRSGARGAGSLEPSEIDTDDHPPGWARRKEIWTIDELLGAYEAEKRQIKIFTKCVEHARSARVSWK